MIVARLVEKGYSISRVCRQLGYSRWAYYKRLRKKASQQMKDAIVRELVLAIRRKLPRLGGHKLYEEIKMGLKEHGIKMGRDKLFDWLREHDLLVKPKKRSTKTTNSRHRFRTYRNLLEQARIQAPDQGWVSDITYLRTRTGFCYLSLITDVYSRKIVGYTVSNSLELTGCLRALKMAINNRKKRGSKDTIHHSDRGIQYCSHAYTGLLQDHDIKISMSAKGDCYENALAERINGILKQEFNLDATFSDLKQATKACKEAIWLYNHQRPHWSLQMQKPAKLYAA